MAIELKLMTQEDDILRCFPTLSQLRPAFSQQQFLAQVLHQQSEGYQLLAAIEGGRVVGCAGFVISTKLAWGKHLYVDDVITDSSSRSSGIGNAILVWLKDHAKSRGCSELHLDSGVQRFAAHKFYLRENFIISSHHFTLVL